MASVWAIGDIHGHAAKLSALLAALPRGETDTTVFLGDYIDRGPDSAGAVRRVLAEHDAAPDRTVLLWGNHEDLAAEHFGIAAPSDLAYDAYDWFRNGGTKAMESFGLAEPDLYSAACPDDLARLFTHLQTFWRSDDPALAPYIWVHAGIPPGAAPEEASGEALLWIREEFLNVLDASGRIVIHGHTPMRQVRVLPDKIGIDTGAAYGGPLTALQLPDRRVFQAGDAGRVIAFDLPPIPA